VQEIRGVKCNWSRGSFRERPEGGTFLGLGIQWINVEKLTNVMVEEFLKFLTSIVQAILEACGSAFE
jgi:hypothetical protein